MRRFFFVVSPERLDERRDDEREPLSDALRPALRDDDRLRRVLAESLSRDVVRRPLLRDPLREVSREVERLRVPVSSSRLELALRAVDRRDASEGDVERAVLLRRAFLRQKALTRTPLDRVKPFT